MQENHPGERLDILRSPVVSHLNRQLRRPAENRPADGGVNETPSPEA